MDCTAYAAGCLIRSTPVAPAGDHNVLLGLGLLVGIVAAAHLLVRIFDRSH